MTRSRLQAELAQFDFHLGDCRKRFPSFKSYASHAFSIGEAKPLIDIYFSGLIHGNEVAGLAVVNRILAHLLSLDTRPPLSVAFLLAMYQQLTRAKGFLDYDLNRSFNVDSHTTAESKRAKELESLASQARIIVDFHQTVQDSKTAFFILPHRLENVGFASQLNTGVNVNLPIVSYPDNGFSAAGKTMLEIGPTTEKLFVRVAIELGKMGFSEEQENLGLQLALESIKIAVKNPKLEFTLSPDQKAWQIQTVIKNDNSAALIPGLINLWMCKKAKSSQRVRVVPSPRQLLKTLFPKYGKLASKSPDLVEIAVPTSVRPA